MSSYPFKLRLIRRNGFVTLDELVPSRGGSYFLKQRVEMGRDTLISAAARTKDLTIMGLGPVVVEPVETDTSDLPGIGE